MRALALAAVFAAALAGCHSRRGPRPESPVVVEAEGWVPADAPGRAQAALAEAKRAAVEKALGSNVAAVTRVDNAARVRQRIVSRADGVIVRYKVLSEGTDSGLYAMRIKAWVRHRTEEDEGPEAYLPPPGDPHVAVVSGMEGEYAERALAGLREGLVQRAVNVVDRGPDLVAAIDVEVRALDASGLEGLRSWRGRAVAVVRDAKSGAVVCEASVSASAVDPLDSGAAAKAAERAGAAAGKELARRLDETLSAR